LQVTSGSSPIVRRFVADSQFRYTTHVLQIAAAETCSITCILRTNAVLYNWQKFYLYLNQLL